MMTVERAIKSASEAEGRADQLMIVGRMLKRRTSIDMEFVAAVLDAAELLYALAEDYRQYVRDNPSKGTGL